MPDANNVGELGSAARRHNVRFAPITTSDQNRLPKKYGLLIVQRATIMIVIISCNPGDGAKSLGDTARQIIDAASSSRRRSESRCADRPGPRKAAVENMSFALWVEC